MSRIDLNRVAIILVEAAYFGDRRTAKRWGITTRTIRNYRYMLEENAELSALFLDRRKDFEGDWAEKIPAAMLSAMGFIRRAAKEADPTDPAIIREFAKAVRILAEVYLTKQVLDARLKMVMEEN